MAHRKGVDTTTTKRENEMNEMNENYLPPEWRNKVFRFQAGGYDGFGE